VKVPKSSAALKEDEEEKGAVVVRGKTPAYDAENADKMLKKKIKRMGI